MTKLTFGKLEIPAVPPLEESSLPSIADVGYVSPRVKSCIDQFDDEIFLNYGYEETFFPYRDHDQYGRDLQKREVDVCTLENEYLSAQFLLGYGGRLWSLYDKTRRKELLFKNSVIRMGNLAARNAWFSGGIEWNCGVPSHHPSTCAPLHTATFTLDDGTPVLRMFQYERIRNIAYQMDFLLPKDSKVLLCRMKIFNTSDETIPMWWWSNMAVTEEKGGRVVVSADGVYTDFNKIFKKESDVLNCNGIDITYPTNSPGASSYFWDIKEDKRKFICHLDKNGYGIVQTSTRRLKGRKLFVWGQGPGGEKWQNFLSADDESGRYLELQAGFSLTQGGSVSMPPKTTWEWMEAYGPLSSDPSKVHGQWQDAICEVERSLEALISVSYLEELLIATRDSIGNKKASTVKPGDGFGALEAIRKQKMGEDFAYSYLDFGGIQEAQKDWLFLLNNGYFEEKCPEDVPPSWMIQDEWVRLLELAVKRADAYNWYTHLQLGAAYFAKKNVEKAKSAINRSLELRESCWALYVKGQIARVEGNLIECAMLCYKAASMRKGDKSLAKLAMRSLLDAKLYELIFNFVGQMPEEVASQGRIKLGYAIACSNTDQIEKAEELLYENGSIVVPDIRENDNPLTTLWFDIQEAKAKRKGCTFDRTTAKPPLSLDFRMTSDTDR